MADKNKKEEKPKQYQLTAEEQFNLSGRREIYRMQKYSTEHMLDAIAADIDAYTNNIIKKRLGIPAEKLVNIDLAKGILMVAEEENKPAEVKKEEKPAILDTDGQPTKP